MEPEKEYTEAELTGEDTPETPAEPVEKAVEEPGESAIPKETETEKEPVVAKEEPVPDKKETPAERMVPLTELVRERKNLQARIKELEDRFQQAQPHPIDPRSKILEDPEEAVGALVSRINELESRIAQRDMELRIKEDIPDFLEVAPKMEEYLYNRGFEEEDIKALIGSSGSSAPKLFSLIKENLSKPDENTLRAQIAADLTPKITEEVTRQLMAKFNITEAPKNIDKLPGSGPTGKLVVETEADFEKLTPEQQQKWLSGEL